MNCFPLMYAWASSVAISSHVVNRQRDFQTFRVSKTILMSICTGASLLQHASLGKVTAFWYDQDLAVGRWIAWWNGVGPEVSYTTRYMHQVSRWNLENKVFQFTCLRRQLATSLVNQPWLIQLWTGRESPSQTRRHPTSFWLRPDTALLRECPSCYFRDSSIHRSMEQNSSLVSENVRYDITGFWFYQVPGRRSNSTISFNLAVFIHDIWSRVSV
jgi:hypothetical protein